MLFELMEIHRMFLLSLMRILGLAQPLTLWTRYTTDGRKSYDFGLNYPISSNVYFISNNLLSSKTYGGVLPFLSLYYLFIVAGSCILVAYLHV